MRRILRIGLIMLLAIALVVQPALANGTVSVVKLNQVQQRDAALTMYVSMSDNLGAPCVGDYTADQFSISVDGKALDVDSVERFDPNTQGIHYVISVDISSSVNNRMMENVLSSLHAFVDNLGPMDTVSLLGFGDDVIQYVINSSDQETLHIAVQSLVNRDGKTALYKGVIDAVDIAAMIGGRSAVIVITDGKDDPRKEVSSYTKESIFERVNAAQVPLYCVGMNDNNGVDADSLLELATVTGGGQFITSAEEVYPCLKMVASIMRSALVLRATLINTENKAGFEEVSTFKVGFQPVDGSFVTSNELRQNINWRNVPLPEPSPTPIPQLAISLDVAEIEYVPGTNTVLTGAIEIEQGTVEASQLTVKVNGQAWTLSGIMRNGNGYTFTAEGAIAEGTETLEVQAELVEFGIASRIQRVKVIQPAPEPTATPLPQLALYLDEDEIEYVAGTNVVLTGAIEIEQGAVEAEQLVVKVNSESWRLIEMMRNGNGYTFSAEGTIAEGTQTLEVQAEIVDLGVASRIQRVDVIQPAPEPTATPAPVLSVELDDNGRDLIFQPGETIVLSGVINVQGEIDSSALVMYVNDVACDMEVLQINHSQYEFTAKCIMHESSGAELSIRVQLEGTEIYSRVQKLFLVTPSPSPDPELYFTLFDNTIIYNAGDTVVIRGNIDISSGEVAPEDLALYVNNVRWDMEITANTDGTYGFTAENTLADADVAQLDVRIRLQSNTKVVSNSEKLALATPEPTPTPTPTPRAVVTPPPTPVPTPAPVTAAPIATEEPVEPSFIESTITQAKTFVTGLIEQGKLWILIAAGAGVLVLIVAIIVLIVLASKKKRNVIAPTGGTSNGFSSVSRDDNTDAGKTVGPSYAEGAATIRPDTAAKNSGSGTISGSAFVDDEESYAGPSEGSGTMRIDPEAGSGTVRLSDAPEYDEEPESEGGGTQRIEEVKFVSLTIEKNAGGRTFEPSVVRIECDEEVVLGRKAPADIIIEDGTVSTRHLMVTYDGVALYVADLGSTNGTKLNGETLNAREPRLIKNGDSAVIGKTTLTFVFDESDLT